MIHDYGVTETQVYRKKTNLLTLTGIKIKIIPLNQNYIELSAFHQTF